MAPEVLSTQPRHASADMFSLGITIYEVCLPLPPPPPAMWAGQNHQYHNPLIHQGSLLPSEGPIWHKLRKGNADPLSGRPPALCQIIAACMAPEPSERPLPHQLLALPLIYAASLEPDPTLANVKIRAMPPPANFHRSASMNDADCLGLFTDFPDEDQSIGGDGSSSDTAAALARNRVSTPTNFNGANFWQWPTSAPTPVSTLSTNGEETDGRKPMETSPLEDKNYPRSNQL